MISVNPDVSISNNNKRNKKFFYIVIVVVFSIFCILMELASCYILHTNSFYLPFLMHEKSLQDAPSMFSADIGWEPHHPNKSGYRGGEKDTSRAIMSVFGDSYARGFKTDIEKSWAHLLEAKLKRPVLNFGVGGYGHDQALLRMEKRYLGHIKTPYVLLGVQSENIARVLNRYRGFYVRKSSVVSPTAKPMFYRDENGEIVLLKNPLSSVDELYKLKDIEFLKEIGKNDYWYNFYGEYSLNEFVHFPYSYYFIKALPYYIKRYIKLRIKDEGEYDDLYENDYALAIMRHIIHRFISVVKKDGSKPIILFLPNRKAMVDYQKNKTYIYKNFYAETKKQYAEDNVAVFDAMDYFRDLVDEGLDVPALFKTFPDGHYNPHGEEILANGLFKDFVEFYGVTP